MIDLLIIAPSRGFDQHVPAGFIFADEVFAEAKLSDPISMAQEGAVELKRALRYLARRYPRRIRVQWVDPWSPAGLWLAFRYRVRDFPAVVMDREQLLTGKQLQFEAFCDLVATALSRNPPDPAEVDPPEGL